MNRELDARVAEAMGYGFWMHSCGQYLWTTSVGRLPYTGEGISHHYTPCDASCVTKAQPMRKDVPSFSSDPAACEMVKAEIRQRNWGYCVECVAGSKWVQCEISGLDSGSERELAKTEYEAVCFAFLAADEAEKRHASEV